MIVLAAKLIASGIASVGVIDAGIGIGTIFGSYLLELSKSWGVVNEVFIITIMGFTLSIATIGFLLYYNKQPTEQKNIWNKVKVYKNDSYKSWYVQTAVKYSLEYFPIHTYKVTRRPKAIEFDHFFSKHFLGGISNSLNFRVPAGLITYIHINEIDNFTGIVFLNNNIILTINKEENLLSKLFRKLQYPGDYFSRSKLSSEELKPLIKLYKSDYNRKIRSYNLAVILKLTLTGNYSLIPFMVKSVLK